MRVSNTGVPVSCHGAVARHAFEGIEGIIGTGIRAAAIEAGGIIRVCKPGASNELDAVQYVTPHGAVAHNGSGCKIDIDSGGNAAVVVVCEVVAATSIYCIVTPTAEIDVRDSRIVSPRNHIVEVGSEDGVDAARDSVRSDRAVADGR